MKKSGFQGKGKPMSTLSGTPQGKQIDFAKATKKSEGGFQSMASPALLIGPPAKMLGLEEPKIAAPENNEAKKYVIVFKAILPDGKEVVREVLVDIPKDAQPTMLEALTEQEWRKEQE